MPINQVPSTNVIVDTSGRLTSLWQAFMASIGTWLGPIGQSGTTTNRPVTSANKPLYVGQPYFDTSLGKPIWVKSLNPTVWSDATGASV